MAKVVLFVVGFATILIVVKSYYNNGYLTYRQLRYCDGFRMNCDNFRLTSCRYNYWEYRWYNDLKYYCNRYLGYCRLHFYPGYYQSRPYFTSNPCRICYVKKIIYNNDDEDLNDGSGDEEIFI